MTLFYPERDYWLGQDYHSAQHRSINSNQSYTTVNINHQCIAVELEYYTVTVLLLHSQSVYILITCA
jgi:hypothetical protein